MLEYDMLEFNKNKINDKTNEIIKNIEIINKIKKKINTDYNVNISYIDSYFPKQPEELYYGNREYKRKIINCNHSKLIKRSTQMLFRIHEGCGNALYLLGINDNGSLYGLNYNELYQTLINFFKIVKLSNCNIDRMRIYKMMKNKEILVSDKKFIITIRISKNINNIEI